MLPVCEICGASMPASKFVRNDKDCCAYCIDIYADVCDTLKSTNKGEKDYEYV
jgi:hypothetical protein